MKGRFVNVSLLVVQIVCAAFFLYDILSTLFGASLPPVNWQLYEFIQIAAALGLMFGAVLTGWVLRQSMRRSAHIEAQLRVASGAFVELLEDKFRAWALTPAERDVAMFSIKGFSISEIAGLRSTSEGTVKAQTNAIYRKAGVNGRAQLLSLFIDDLMGEALIQV